MARKSTDELKKELAASRRNDAQVLIKDTIDGGDYRGESAVQFTDAVARMLHRIEADTDGLPGADERVEDLRSELVNFVRDAINHIELPDVETLSRAVERTNLAQLKAAEAAEKVAAE